MILFEPAGSTVQSQHRMITRGQGFLTVLLIWAAIYLPALGSLEIKGEEGRRILPAIRMLDTGDYLVPRVGSEPYLRKPPLINWLVAASFRVFRQRNEWTARLPSVLCVLGAAFCFITIARTSLGNIGSLVAALIWLTNAGLIEKGRLIEIEALYVSLFAAAFICWLSWWKQRRSPWLTWIVPWIFLGLGWLAKGPLHLFFFYAILVAILWQAREGRALWSVPHLIGVIVMLSIFAAWAIPFEQATGGLHTAEVWSRQFSGRLSPEAFHWKTWLINIPKSLAYFLPWLIFVPLIGFHRGRFREEHRALIWGMAISLVIVDLVPGALPRYTMPLIAPFAWLTASVLCDDNYVWPQFLGGESLKKRWRVIGLVVVLMCVGVWIYAFGIVPRLRPKLKPIAAKIEAVIPRGERLYAVDPDYEPFLFYVHRPISYVSRVEDLPRDTHYFLVRPENEDRASRAGEWLSGPAQRVLSIRDYRQWRTSLFIVQRR